jgi:hypothetical protein
MHHCRPAFLRHVDVQVAGQLTHLAFQVGSQVVVMKQTDIGQVPEFPPGLDMMQV